MSIKIDLKIFLFLFLFFLTSQIEMYLLLMTFAIIHELAHLILGLLLKFKPKELKITPVGLQIGFFIKYEENAKKIGKGSNLEIKKIWIALAGPIMNFIIILVVTVLYRFHVLTIEQGLYQNIIYANFLIGLFNLIPIYPLDGGRILNEILHITVGLKKSYQYTYMISKITIIVITIISSIGILYIQNIAVVIILVYLWGLVIREKIRYHTKEKIAELNKKVENCKIMKEVARKNL